MKRTFILLATLFSLGNLNAQNSLVAGETTIKLDKNKANVLNKKFDFTSLNRSKKINESVEIEEGKLSTSNKEDGHTTPEPFAKIKSLEWNVGDNVGTLEKLFFSTKYTYGNNASLTVSIYTDDVKVDKEFTIDLPTSANNNGVINDFSSKLIDGKNELLVPIYVHFFEGGSGPEFQKNQIWLVSEKGEIIHKADAVSAFIKVDATGKHRYFVVNSEDDSQTTLTLVDLENEANNKSYAMPTNLIYNFEGSPIDFKNIDGKETIGVIHYDKIFMNNNTLEYTRDNTLVFNYFDYEMNLVKRMNIPNIGFDEENPYVFPLATYGMFYQSDKYDLTKDVFNSDDKYEVIFGSYFYDMMADRSWYNYYLVNEDGKVLKTIQDDISSPGYLAGIEMSELPNQSDQVMMLIGEGDAVSGLKVFDLPSFNVAHSFDAYYNEELLSLSFNRLAVGNSFNYVVGLSYMEEEGRKSFGVLNYYDAKGDFQKKQRLTLTDRSQRFVPYLTQATLDPKVIDEDDALEFIYLDMHADPVSGKNVNKYWIAKSENDVLATFVGDNENGNISSIGYMTNRAGKYDRLYTFYGSQYSSTGFLTSFYQLPMKTLEVKEQVKTKQSIVYLSNRNEIVFQYNFNNYRVYSIDGRLITHGTSVKTLSTLGWSKGVYVVKTMDAVKGSNNAKIIVN